MTTQPMAPAGWYADNGQLRWWDGVRWTPYVAPAGPAAPPPPTTAPWPTRSPQRRAVVGVALGLALALAAGLFVTFLGDVVVGGAPTEGERTTIEGLSALAATAALVVGCVYGARKGTP